MEKRQIVAMSLSSIYIAACILALWHKWDAALLFALASPVAAGFMFPKQTNFFQRMILGALIDAFLGALVFVPPLGEIIDVLASMAAIIIVIIKFNRFKISLPGGVACVVLYLYLLNETSVTGIHAAISDVHHPLWFYFVMIIVSILGGSLLLAMTAVIFGLVYEGRAEAIFFTIGFPWYLINFLLTIFMPNGHVKKAHHAAKSARGI